MQLDKETGEIMQRGTKLRDFVKSDAWGMIKGELTNKLIALADITTLEEVDPLKMLQDIQVRKQAINLVMGWVREVEGSVSQHEANEEAFKKIKEETVILHLGDL